jgi:uncharacterized protein
VVGEEWDQPAEVQIQQWTVVAITLLYGIGFGWTGKVGPTLVLVLAVVVFGAQVQFSVLRLRHVRYGPVVWLWRSLTYGKRQPMRLRERPAVVGIVT